MKLAEIVTLWRETLAPEAALAAHHAALQVPPLTWPATPNPLQAEWMTRAIAKPSPETVAELMRVTDFGRTSSTHLLARFERMTAWQGDPNMTRWLVDVFARPTRQPTAASQKCFRRVFNLLIQHLDLDGADRLRGWMGTTRERLEVRAWGADFIEENFERVLAKSKARLDGARALTRDERAALERSGLLTPPVATTSAVTLDALLEAVYAAPHDDAPRAVLADFLQERGDPRGELIALDLLPSPTREQRARRNALVDEHGKGWFPPALDKIVRRDAEYQRGFLARGTLMRNDRTPIELSTFRELTVGEGRAPELEHPVFRSVEAWTGFRADAGVWMIERPQPRIRRLGLRTEMTHAPDRLAAQIRPTIWPAVTEIVIDVLSLYGIRGWNGGLAPEWMEDVVKQLAQRLPSLSRVAIEPFAVFDRDGNTDEIYIHKHLLRELVGSPMAEAPHRWLDWLAFRNVPVLVEGSSAPYRLQPLMGTTPVRAGHAPSLPPLA